MSEIDKLVNRAYPDELRKVTPIAVDEDAILGRTLEKLGLEKDTQPSGEKRPRHGERRPAKLVEVPLEREKGGWMKWAGWAVAACVAVVCAVTWWPKLDGPRLGAPVAPGAYFEEIGENIDNSLAGGETPYAAPKAGGDQDSRAAIEKTIGIIADVQGVSLHVAALAADQVEAEQKNRNGIMVTQVNPTKTGFTLYVSFQNHTLEEIGLHHFEVYDDNNTSYFIAKRSNMEGQVIIEFSRGTGESTQDSAILLVNKMGGEAADGETGGATAAAFHLYPEDRMALPFTDEEYALYTPEDTDSSHTPNVGGQG